MAGARWGYGHRGVDPGAAHRARLVAGPSGRRDQHPARDHNDAGVRGPAGTREDQQTSDYAVPWWRLNVFRSLLLARLGDEKAAADAQDQALAVLPRACPASPGTSSSTRG